MHTYKITLEFADKRSFVYECKAHNDMRAKYEARREAEGYGYLGKVVSVSVEEL